MCVGVLRDKPWGTVLTEWEESGKRSDILTIRSGGFCSLHYHRHEFNVFRVLSGDIYVGPFNCLLRAMRHLPEDTGFIIPPNTLHQFWTPGGAVVREVCWDSSPDDIVRLTDGGRSSQFPETLRTISTDFAPCV